MENMGADYPQEYADRIAEWELMAVAEVCREIGTIGKMTPEQAKKYNAEKQAKKIEKIIVTTLSVVMIASIQSLPKAYTDAFDVVHRECEYMYKYRDIPFFDVSDDKVARKLAKQYAKKNGAELMKFAKTKAVKVLNDAGQPVVLRKQILQYFSDASKFVIDGHTDFYSAMRKTVLDLGGSGFRVEYPSGITRRLDTVVRQNMLYNIKMASAEYSRRIGEELGCDGIEVSFSTNPRPSHRYMEGKQYAKHGGKTVNGVYYEGADDAKVYDRLYRDYNCNHRETPIILGVSEPRYSPQELTRLKADNEKQFTISGKTGDGYYWSQKMRALETETRKAKDQINALKAFGNSEPEIAELNKRIAAYRKKYNEIADVTGIAKEPKRMRV